MRRSADAVTRLLEAIRQDTRSTARYTGREALSGRVLGALGKVAREAFVPSSSAASAHRNMPLPIGHGQTISQPFIVALMTDLLEPAPDHRVLEIGTGSGYQAAVLAELVSEVYSIEIIDELAAAAAARLGEQGYGNVHVRVGDGWYGWPEAGPFDGIIVTAVGEQVPELLLGQLVPGGRMVLPLGSPRGSQMLTLLEKREDGGVNRRDVLPVQFVPLTGDH